MEVNNEIKIWLIKFHNWMDVGPIHMTSEQIVNEFIKQQKEISK